MTNYTPPPWKIYDDSDPLHIAIKGFRPDTGGAHVADVISPDNAAFLLKAVNNHDTLVAALTLAEDVLSRAPFSNAMWPNGMHPQVGIEQIRKALAAVSRAVDPS